MSANDNVLLSFDGLPPFSHITPQQVKPAVEQAIAQAHHAAHGRRVLENRGAVQAKLSQIMDGL